MAQTTHPLAAKVVAAAKKYADEGYSEGPNNDTVFGKRYGMNHQPWCAMFVSGCFDDAGLVHLVAASTKKGFASCDAGAEDREARVVNALVRAEELNLRSRPALVAGKYAHMASDFYSFFRGEVPVYVRDLLDATDGLGNPLRKACVAVKTT